MADLHMADLRLSLVQTILHWHDPGANRAMLAHKLASLEGETDVVLLPEMFSTGFSMEAASLSEPMDGPTLDWMSTQSARLGAVVVGSFIVREEESYWNRLVWMRPDGSFETYDKRHLFRMAGEQEVYSSGSQKLIVHWKGWKICPLVCYDLRFPVWSRNIGNDYDVLLYLANWPDRRSLAWKTLLRARAIENLSFVAGVNRVGEDGNGVSYSGDSAVYSPTGDAIWEGGSEEAVWTITLSWAELEEWRKRFPAYLDADEFEIKAGQ